MARKKQPQNLWIKISYLFLIFGIFTFTNLYISDYLTELIRQGLEINNDIFSINYMQNTGAAFSILKEYPFILIALAVIALISMFAYIIRHAGTMTFNGIFWFSVLMSGIFCNLYERVVLGYVRDFIYVNIPFATFNIADACLVVGTIIMAWYILFIHDKHIAKISVDKVVSENDSTTNDNKTESSDDL